MTNNVMHGRTCMPCVHAIVDGIKTVPARFRTNCARSRARAQPHAAFEVPPQVYKSYYIVTGPRGPVFCSRFSPGGLWKSQYFMGGRLGNLRTHRGPVFSTIPHLASLARVRGGQHAAYLRLDVPELPQHLSRGRPPPPRIRASIRSHFPKGSVVKMIGSSDESKLGEI